MVTLPLPLAVQFFAVALRHANVTERYCYSADERSRQLEAVAVDLLAHVIGVLEDDVVREAYGQCYTQILSRVLEVRNRISV